MVLSRLDYYNKLLVIETQKQHMLKLHRLWNFLVRVTTDISK